MASALAAASIPPRTHSNRKATRRPPFLVALPAGGKPERSPVARDGDREGALALAAVLAHDIWERTLAPAAWSRLAEAERALRTATSSEACRDAARAIGEIHDGVLYDRANLAARVGYAAALAPAEEFTSYEEWCRAIMARLDVDPLSPEELVAAEWQVLAGGASTTPE